MEPPLSAFVEELREKGLSLMIYRDGELVFSSFGRGITPLLDAVEALGLEHLHGAIVVDKFIGRAAALIIVHVKASEAHAALISAGAKEVFRKHGLRHLFADETDVIAGSDGVGLCPFERLVMDISDPAEAYAMIRAKAEGMR